jgi:hypothetical protein
MPGSSFVGVLHVAMHVSRNSKDFGPCFPLCSCGVLQDWQFDVSTSGIVVSKPVEPLPLVRRPDATSWEYDHPRGVVFSRQFKLYMVEPSGASLACNLLAKDDCRSAARDKTRPDREQVSLVLESLLLPGWTERLARATARPHFPVVRPSCSTQGVAPHPDPCEKMALSKPGKVGWCNVLDRSVIYNPL